MTAILADCAEYSASGEVRRAPDSVVIPKERESGFWLGTGYPVTAIVAASRSLVAESKLPPAAPPTIRGPRKVAVCSPAMRRVFELLDPLARSEVTITLIGDTGTGKDVLAR